MLHPFFIVKLFYALLYNGYLIMPPAIRNGETSSSATFAPQRRGGRRNSQRLMTIVTTIFLISLYYSLSIGLTFYQKQLFQEFKFPLTTVVIHLVIKFLLATSCRRAYTCYTGQPRVTVGWNSYWRRILPPGIAAGLDIGLSQWSLEFITVTLYTMSKSTALLFILIFAIIFKLEEMNCRVIILVVFIAGGLAMFTYKYTQFHAFGFSLAITASILSGLRWTLSQMVMQKQELGLGNPIDMVYHIQPWMVLPLLPLAIIMEGSKFAASQYGFSVIDWQVAGLMWLRLLLGAVLAFLMEVCEYLVICFTSSLNFSIAGVAKEIITLSFAIGFGHEQLSHINTFGLVLCILGIIIHVSFKAHNIRSMKHLPISPQVSGSVSSNLTPLLSDVESDPQGKD